MKANEKEETVRVKKLATAAALSLVLALGLAPGLAQADDAAQQGGQFVAGQFATQAEPTVDSVSAAIKALSDDPTKVTAADKEKIEAIQADYEALSEEDQATIDETAYSEKNSQSLGRILEAALWAVQSYETDSATMLENGTYTDKTKVAISSESDKGKSTSSRVRIWKVKDVTVKDGKATATIYVTDDKDKVLDSYSAIWMGGTEYPCDATDKMFHNVPISLKDATYFAGVSKSMPTPIMYKLTVTSNYEATKDLTITNNVKMFSVKGAKLVTADHKTDLVLTMGSDSFSMAFPDTPDKAAATDEGVATLTEDKTFTISVAGKTDGTKFDASFFSKKNSKWYPRATTIDATAGTLVFDESTWVDPNPANTVDAAIAKIQKQTRTETTDADCLAAKAAWDALTDEQKKEVEEYDYFGLDTGDASKDDPLNADEIGENEILVVSFGTSFNDSRTATIGGVEKALAKAYPNWSVRRAFTAQIIINHIQARDGVKIDNVAQAMDRAAANNVKTLVVQPTHLMYGAEYDELKAEIDKYADKMTIIYAAPLLGEVGETSATINEDKLAVAQAAVAAACADAKFDDAAAAAKAGTAIVLMGHGTSHTAAVTYDQMQSAMVKLGFENVFVGTVEGKPASTECQAVIKKVKDAGYKNVILRPLMVVAGDHANNDMADLDDPESWASQFTAVFGKDNVTCQIAGLGQISDIQKLYVAHTTAVLPGGSEFSDVPADSWFVGYVDRAVKMGLMAGYTDDQGKPRGVFGAGDDVTRGQVATIMYRYAEPNSKATTDPEAYEDNKVKDFTDNADKKFYTAAINWAYEKEIMTGDVDPDTGKSLGTVRPDDPISRQELATMLKRFAKDSGKAGDGKWKDAPDATSVAKWAEPGIDWCFANGIMTGNSETHKLNPTDNTKREEAAKMLVVAYQEVIA